MVCGEGAVVGGRWDSTNWNEVVILLLRRRVRRVAVMHACDEECMVQVSAGTVGNSAMLLRGGVYRVVTRERGYPPHLG